MISLRLSILFIFTLSMNAFCQSSLIINTRGRVKRVHYYLGDKVSVKLKNKIVVSGVLSQLMDSSMVINNRIVLLNDIGVVYRSRGKGYGIFGPVLVISGSVYIGLDIVNNLINYNSNGYLVSPSAWIPASLLIGMGEALLILQTQRIKVTDASQLRILDTSPIPISLD